MNSLGSKLKERRLELDLTLEEVGEKCGVSKSTVMKWESGEIENMKRDKIVLLAKVLGVTPTYVLGIEDDIKPPKAKGVKIPVLGRVAAGVPIEAIEEIIDYEEITEDLARTGEFFCLVISGDSMAPRMLENDIIVVKKQSSIESGEIAVVIINGCDATVKKVVRHENGISLIPTNQAYSPKFFTNDEVLTLPVGIIGKVVELRGKF